MLEPKGRTRLTWKRIVGYVISVAIVVAIFAWAIPKYADYHDVITAIRTLTPLEFWSLVAAPRQAAPHGCHGDGTTC